MYRSVTYISWSSHFALYLENYLMDEGHTLANGSMWHKDWPHKIYVGQWPIFRGPVILLILKAVLMEIFGIMDHCDRKVGLIKTDVGEWPIFHGPVILPYILTIWWMKVTLDIVDQCDTKIDHIKYIYRSVTYISWSRDFALYRENYLMDEGRTLDNGSVWHKDGPHKIYVSQWPVFCGPVILLNILKAVWWRNITFGIMDRFDTKFGHIKQLWVSDMYFMVQWFCFIYWNFVMDEGHTWYNGSVWHKGWPQ